MAFRRCSYTATTPVVSASALTLFIISAAPVEPKANHVQDELDTIQAIRKYLAPRHAPSQRTTHVGGSGTCAKSGTTHIVGAGNNYWGEKPGDKKPHGRGRCTADTGRRQTPAGAARAGRQNARGYGGPLKATDMEEREKEGHYGPRTRRKERGKEGHASTAPVELFRSPDG